MTADPVLLLVHGFAYGPGVWRPLMRHLPDSLTVQRVDLGFSGRARVPALPGDRPVIGVGHSMGVAWLLENAPVPLTGLVSLNGFARLARAPDLPQGVAPRVLARMQMLLDQDPAAMLAEFRRRAGDPTPSPARLPDVEPLRAALTRLATLDARPALAAFPGPVLALAGGADAIVPPALTTATFATVRWQQEAGHVLPLTHPAWCAEQVRAFAETLPAHDHR